MLTFDLGGPLTPDQVRTSSLSSTKVVNRSRCLRLFARIAIASSLVVLGSGRVCRAADCWWKATATANFNASAGNWTCGVIPG
ncbi:MAG TPA: hypothetical protein VI456_16440, partial [Polyangia bacterium]